MTLDIEKLKKLNAERTRGEWDDWGPVAADTDGTMIMGPNYGIAEVYGGTPSAKRRAANAAFITEAANQMDAILSRLKEADRMEEALESISYHFDNQDLNHVEYRVKAAECARATLKGEDNAR